MMPKAAAPAAVPKEAQFPPLNPEWHRRTNLRVQRRHQRRATPLERRDSAPDDERGRLRRFDENAANHPTRSLGNFPPITQLESSESTDSGPIITYDIRRPPSGPSSSSAQPPAPQRLRSRSLARDSDRRRSRSPSPERRRNDRSVRRRGETPRLAPWAEPSGSSEGSPVRLAAPVQRPRPNKIAAYAEISGLLFNNLWTPLAETSTIFP